MVEEAEGTRLLRGKRVKGDPQVLQAPKRLPDRHRSGHQQASLTEPFYKKGQEFVAKERRKNHLTCYDIQDNMIYQECLSKVKFNVLNFQTIWKRSLNYSPCHSDKSKGFLKER